MKLNPHPSKIAVAMSGGVDSSVAAALLVESGHRVVGFTLKLWDAEDEEHARKVCCTAVMARDAGRVCALLGIPHYTLDLRDDFRREVVARFESEYIAGRTPNPCVHCNSKVKWGAMWQKAQALGMGFIATGHYARIESPAGKPFLSLKKMNEASRNGRPAGGTMRLLRGIDRSKDQSYFLWEIPHELLARTIFPVGELTKHEVRTVARRLKLPVADKAESQEVCFIPRDDYRSWLLSRRPDLAGGNLSGEMIDTRGVKLADHSGYPLFTIGQRKGLGLGGGRKYYVTAIDPATRKVHLGDKEDLARQEFELTDFNLLQDFMPDRTESLEVKIRYRDPGVSARVQKNGGGKLRIFTDEPVYAVTPGQSAVLYRGDEVVAGGIIAPR